MLTVAVRVPLEPQRRDACLLDRGFRDTTGGDADLDDSSTHESTSVAAVCSSVMRRASTGRAPAARWREPGNCTRGSAPGAADHPLDAGLQHHFTALVQDPMAIRDDATVGV